MMEFDVLGFLLNIHETENLDFSLLLKGIQPIKTSIYFKFLRSNPAPTQ